MTLESLLKPVKVVDEEILRQYTKISKKWEGSGKDKYLLAGALTIGGYVAIMVTPRDPEVRKLFFREGILNNLFPVSIATGYIGLFVHDIVHTLEGVINPKLNNETIGLAEDKFDYFSKKIQRFWRLPLLSFGTFCFYDPVRSIIETGNFSQYQDSAALAVGVAFTSLASSMYIKDSNPKLLQKKPFWKTAYTWVREKVSSVAPQPTPQPIPVQTYASLERCIQTQPE